MSSGDCDPALARAIKELFGEEPPFQPFKPSAIYQRSRGFLALFTEDVCGVLCSDERFPFFFLVRKQGVHSPIVGVQLWGFREMLEDPEVFVAEVEVGHPSAPSSEQWAASGHSETFEQGIERMLHELPTDPPIQYPYAWYNRPGDQLEVYFCDLPMYYGQRINHWLTLYRERGTDQVVGVVITGFRELCSGRVRERLGGLLPQTSSS